MRSLLRHRDFRLLLAVGGAIGQAALAASLLSRAVWNLSSKAAAASP